MPMRPESHSWQRTAPLPDSTDDINGWRKTETALIAKNTMGWSTYLNALQFDYGTLPSGAARIASSAIRAPATNAPSSISVRVTDTTFARTGSMCIEPSVRQNARTQPSPQNA